MGFFGGGGGGTTPVNMVGASTGTAGTAGYVPAPAAGEINSYLTGAGTFNNAYFQPKITSATSDRFYCPSFFSTGNGNNFTSNLTTQAYITMPICLPSISVASLRLRQNAAPSSNGTAYVALYDSTTDGLPNSPIITSSFTYATSEGALTKSMTISPSVQVKSGIYYGAIYFSTTGTYNMIANGRGEANYFGTKSSDTPGSRASFQCPYFSNSKTNGTWENPAPSIQFTNQNAAYCFYLEVGV